MSLDSGSEPVRTNATWVSSLVVMLRGSAIGASLVTASKMSARAGVPLLARFKANEVKATAPPPLLIDVSVLLSSAPCVSELVLPVTRSCTRMSRVLLLSSSTRLLASEENATKRPSALIDGLSLSLSESGVRSSVDEVCRSWTKISRNVMPLVSPLARLPASEAKATNRPSALIDGVRLQLSPPAVSSSVVSVIRS